jgi:phage tail protein X
MTAKLTGEYYDYTTIAGDRWDLLAWRYYGDAHKQTVILEANRHLILDDLSVPSLVLPRGLKLKIPVIEDEATNTDLLPPWKRDKPDYGA